MNIRQASRFYQVPRETLRRHVKGLSTSFRRGPKPKLPKTIEKELSGACELLASSGYGIRTFDLQVLGEEVALRENITPFKNDLPTRGWIQRFKKRNKCSHRKAQNVSTARMNAKSLQVKENFYSKLKEVYEVLQPQGLDATTIFNVDETGCTVVGEGGKVIAAKGQKSVRQRTSAERGENVTVVATVNAAATTILPPTVIFKGVQIHEDYLKGAMDGVVFATSKSSFIDSELFSEYLSRFIQSIPPKRPVLLLLDGHASHLTLEVINKARDNKIHMLMFPPHTTHLYQPLDVGVFGPLTKAFNTACIKLMRKNKIQKLQR